MWVAHLALGLAALYATVVAAMFLAQTWLLFPTALAGAARVQLPASARRLEAMTPDGEVLSSYSLAGQRIAVALGMELGDGVVDGAVEVVRASEGLVGQVVPLQIAPGGPPPRSRC